MDLTRFAWDDATSTLEIRPGRENGNKAERVFRIESVPGGKPKDVKFSGGVTRVNIPR